MKAVSTIDLTKHYGNIVANDGVNLSIEKGSISAIVGENGAGKTTLMNMLYGLIQPTLGRILVNGEDIVLRSPLDAIWRGIAMVHQHFKLVPGLTVYENVLMGDEIMHTFGVRGRRFRTPFIDRRRSARIVDDLIDRHDFKLKASNLVKNLSVGAKQKIEILKLLYRDVDILIFDEPTAVLTPQDVDEFLSSLKRMRDSGKTIILITHKIEEVMTTSDFVIVMKLGKMVATLETGKTSREEISRLMVGHDVSIEIRSEKSPGNEAGIENRDNALLEVRKLSLWSNDRLKALDNVSFDVCKGEILGVAGVEGNGQSYLIKALSGLVRVSEGTVKTEGVDITNNTPDRLREREIAFIPEERYFHGLCKKMSIKDNLIAGYHRELCRFGLMDNERIEKRSREIIREFDIRIPGIESDVGLLSGGNAQKIIIGRELSANPRLLIAAQPTRGVDIGAIESIHRYLLDFRDLGKGILLVSSELSEIMNLSDRILVMFKGRITGEVEGGNASKEDLGLLMAGIGGRG